MPTPMNAISDTEQTRFKVYPNATMTTHDGTGFMTKNDHPAVTEWLAGPAHSNNIAHREWPELDTLHRDTILGHVLELSKRCLETRESSHIALLHLESNIQTLSQTSVFEGSAVNYLHAWRVAQDSGQDCSVSQRAYGNAVMTMSMLVADLMRLVRLSTFRPEAVEMFYNGINQEAEEELGTRYILKRIAHEGSGGSERSGMQQYLDCMKERLARWGELELKLEGWAVEATHFLG